MNGIGLSNEAHRFFIGSAMVKSFKSEDISTAVLAGIALLPTGIDKPLHL